MRRLLLTAFSLLVLPPFLAAQVLDADITLNDERLEPTQQTTAGNLEYDLEQYINNYEYTDDTYSTRVPLIIQIYMQSANDAGAEISFDAQILVTNGTDQRYFDRNWSFPYSSGQNFQHGIYSPVTSVVDFYCYLILAGEVDTYGRLAGTAYYNMALEIANRARQAGGSGWRSRINRLDDLQNHRDLRILKYTFFDAYWDFQEGKAEDAAIGMKETMILLEKILNHNQEDKYTKIFLDGQAEKFGWLAARIKRAEYLRRLSSLDPDNEDTYQAFLR